ncbi:MAG: transposase [Cyclobacteriaceae bacterium]|nr:transposase [Cyclobacteriaceae bacterium]
MNFNPNSIYHVYNRGNNKQNISFENRNYYYFLKKIELELTPICDVLAYCLMPNHFHLLIYVPEKTMGLNLLSNQNQQFLVRKFGTIQSSYCQAINKQENRTGSLFQQKTKAKLLNTDCYILTCFHYIHQNPLKAKLVKKMEEWTHSSFKDYLAETSAVCKISTARELIQIPLEKEDFYKESYKLIEPDLIKSIF